MKTKIVIIFLSIGISVNAQIEFGFYQDFRLAFTEDDHGNKPYTADVVGIIKFYNGGNRPDHWSKEIYGYTFFEFADLSGGEYYRWGFGPGYTFNPFKNVNFTLQANHTDIFDVKRISVSTSFDYGFINRWKAASFSWNGLIELSYKITDEIKFSLLAALTQRGDLKDKWGTTEPTKSFYGGATYRF